jgi:drug/metabolite transporter (DMT)-like permease
MGLFLLFSKKKLWENFKAGFNLGLILWILFITQTIGLNFTSTTNSAFITGLFIVLLPLVSFLIFKDIPSKIRIISIFISLAGLWILTGGVAGINKGDLITLITALFCAFHILLIDKYVKNNMDPFVLCFQQFFWTSIFSLITCISMKISLDISELRTVYVILYLAIFATVSTFIMQFIAQKYTSPVKVTLILTLEPVFAAIFAWTLGGEEFILKKALGGILIFFAIILSETPLRKHKFIQF